MATVFHKVQDLFHKNNDALATIGAVVVVYIALKTVGCLWRGLKVYILARTLGLSVDLKSLGSWAVVTGATDGIGRAYADQLADQGLNVVLVSRSADKLVAAAQEIESKYKVKTKWIAVDFTGGKEIYEKIAEGLQGIDIAVLVNNVGMSDVHPMFFAETSDQVSRDIITVNTNSVTFMTKLVLPAMVEKRKGAIINISSLSGVQPTPLLAIYSATKAFVEFFSSITAMEYKSKGIIIQCVAPGFVATKMSRIRTGSFFAPFPDSYVRSALATVGVAAHTYGCLAHGIQAFVSLSLPTWLCNKLTMALMTSARAKAMKKQQKTQ